MHFCALNVAELKQKNGHVARFETADTAAIFPPSSAAVAPGRKLKPTITLFANPIWTSNVPKPNRPVSKA